MKIRALARRLPWLIPLLAGCGGDDAGGTGGTESTTGDETGTTTMSTTMSTSTTTTAPTTGVDTTGVDTTDGDTTGVDTTHGEGTTSSGETTGRVNGAPQAVDDVVFTAQNTAVLVAAADGLLVNDTDPDADALTVTAFDVVSTAGGTVVVADDGGVGYTPPAGFWGPDNFGYTIEDGAGEVASATVTVFVAPLQIPLADVAAGLGGFVLDGEAFGDVSGFSVSGAGDVNGDGMDDLIVGAYGAAPNDSFSGRSYVVFGKADTSAVELSDITAGTDGFVLDGEAVDHNSGYSVSGAGDVNGDGMDDLIVGAPFASPNGSGSGRSYVVFGKADTAAVELSDITAQMGGFVLHGEFTDDNSGFSVSGAGDVNGDGMDDLIVGAFGADPNGGYSGRSYVVFGKPDTMAVQLSDVTAGTGGFVLDGEAGLDVSGVSVSGAGDVNADGMDDLIVGARSARPSGLHSGRSYVVFGKADTVAVELSAVTAGSGGFTLDGEATFDFSGHSVSGAGDVNGDGMDDLVVGAYGADPSGGDSGRSYVVFGKADTAGVELSAITVGMGGFALDGEVAGDNSGFSVSGAGDVNGDGMDDVLVGAPFASNDAGRSYLVFGKADTAVVDLGAVASGIGGFVLDGETPDDRSGHSVSGAGDVNADGMDDLVVGAHLADVNVNNSGRSYVVFGVPTPDP